MFYVLNLVICKHFHNHVIEVYIQYIFDFALQRLSSEILRKKLFIFRNGQNQKLMIKK